jgi:hypothetical protein
MRYRNKNGYRTWEHFRVKKKFTLFPLRIYQRTSHRTWWSWLKTSYIFQEKIQHGREANIIQWLRFYFTGHYWKNERMSWLDEYYDYIITIEIGGYDVEDFDTKYLKMKRKKKLESINKIK